jgi:hypothetical protein
MFVNLFSRIPSGDFNCQPLECSIFRDVAMIVAPSSMDFLLGLSVWVDCKFVCIEAFEVNGNDSWICHFLDVNLILFLGWTCYEH